MPKRKRLKLSKETLDAIKLARERGIALTEDEVAVIRASTYQLRIPKLPKLVTAGVDKQGRSRFWQGDRRRGPGTLDPPLFREQQELERDILTQQAKDDRKRRGPPTEAAARARRARSKVGKIEAALREHGIDRHGVVERVAVRLHVSEGYVRKVRARMRQSEGTE